MISDDSSLLREAGLRHSLCCDLICDMWFAMSEPRFDVGGCILKNQGRFHTHNTSGGGRSQRQGAQSCGVAPSLLDAWPRHQSPGEVGEEAPLTLPMTPPPHAGPPFNTCAKWRGGDFSADLEYPRCLSLFFSIKKSMQQVKDPALFLHLWLGSLLWRSFNSWPRTFGMLWARPPKIK